MSIQVAQDRHDRLSTIIGKLERERHLLSELLRNARLEIGHDIEALDVQAFKVNGLLIRLLKAEI